MGVFRGLQECIYFATGNIGGRNTANARKFEKQPLFLLLDENQQIKL